MCVWYIVAKRRSIEGCTALGGLLKEDHFPRRAYAVACERTPAAHVAYARVDSLKG